MDIVKDVRINKLILFFIANLQLSMKRHFFVTYIEFFFVRKISGNI